MEQHSKEELALEISTALAPVVLKLIDKHAQKRVEDALNRAFGGAGAPAPAARTPAPKAAPAKKAPLRPVQKKAPAAAARPGNAPKAAASKRAAGAKATRKATVSLEAVEAALANRPEGLRSEALRQVLGLEAKDRRELAARLTEWTKAGHLSRTGDRRTTTYRWKGQAKAKKG